MVYRPWGTRSVLPPPICRDLAEIEAPFSRHWRKKNRVAVLKKLAIRLFRYHLRVGASLGSPVEVLGIMRVACLVLVACKVVLLIRLSESKRKFPELTMRSPAANPRVIVIRFP